MRRAFVFAVFYKGPFNLDAFEKMKYLCSVNTQGLLGLQKMFSHLQ